MPITMDGPGTLEQANPNPFTDYRLDVLLSQGNKSARVSWPGLPIRITKCHNGDLGPK